jgi:hypothetical protein
MESSTVLAFRIFVMLSCLIIVPMAAIFGSAFPDVVKTVLVDRIVSWSTGQPVENPPPADPNGFREVAPGPPAAREPGNWEAAPRWGAPAATASWQAPAQRTPGEVVPVGGQMAPDVVNRSNFSAPVAAPGPGAPAAGPQAIPAGPSSALSQSERFTELARRLRAYGATYYLLETWGADGELYRFHCRMAVGNNPNYARPFEATNRDALAAMSEVVAQVEAWRSGRQP